jgi:hypothetical protein
VGRSLCERAAKTADSGAGSGHDYDIGHFRIFHNKKRQGIFRDRQKWPSPGPIADSYAASAEKSTDKESGHSNKGIECPISGRTPDLSRA